MCIIRPLATLIIDVQWWLGAACNEQNAVWSRSELKWALPSARCLEEAFG